MSEPFKVALLVFPGLTQLDPTGPQEVFTRVRGVTAVTVWKDRAPLRSADLLCIPGGPGHLQLMGDITTLGWIRQVAQAGSPATAPGALVERVRLAMTDYRSKVLQAAQNPAAKIN